MGVAHQPSEEVVVKMDELSDVLCKIADLSECVRLVHFDLAIRQAAERASLVINAFVEELNTNTCLHHTLDVFMKSQEFKECDEVTKRTTELLMSDFESCGIHLVEGERKKVVELNNRILELSHRFMHNTSQPTIVSRKNCPKSLVKYFSSSHDDAHNITVDHVPYLSRDNDLRCHSYQIYFADIPTQRKILEELLSARDRVSRLTGYDSFAERTLKICMAKNTETVKMFLEALSDKIMPLAKLEAQTMQRFNPSYTDKHSPPLMAWDINLCMSEAKKEYFQVQSSELCKYFSLHNTLDGLGNIFRRLFGVTMETIPTKRGEIWDDDVIKLAFVHESDGLLGYTYCDLFSRPGKSISDCHFTIQGGRALCDGTYQHPIIAICCNFQRNYGNHDNSCRDNKTILLSPNAVENLFHEMGHALHSMLGRSRYQNVTGTRCSTDFAEVPSTLMEYFLNDSRVLQSFARHYQTGRPIPELYFSTFQHLGRLFPAFDMQLHITYALTDLLIHTNKQISEHKSVTEYASELYRRYAPVETSPGVTWLLRFNYLYGYGARYYSYLWARAMSCLIWRNSFAEDPFSRKYGNLLHQMLKYGGGLSPDVLVRDILTSEPSIQDLVDSLYTDVTEQQQKFREFVK